MLAVLTGSFHSLRKTTQADNVGLEDVVAVHLQELLMHDSIGHLLASGHIAQNVSFGSVGFFVSFLK